MGRIKVNGIEDYTNKSTMVNYHVINYPDELNNYFVSNGHLNKTGNKILANLLLPLLSK